MQTHLLTSQIACGRPVGGGTVYREDVTCPECLRHRDPWTLIRRFAEYLGPVPQGYQQLDERDWQLQADKISEESTELMFAMMNGAPQNFDTLLHQAVEMMDMFIAGCVLLHRQGIDPKPILAAVIDYDHKRASHGMENGQFTHDEQTKAKYRDEMFAELLAVIWRGRGNV